MTVKADTVEGPLLHKEASPTAASAWDRKYPASGVQTYRVLLQTPAGQMARDVEAATGDEAAEKALEGHLGSKVAHVGPAPQKND
jgi:hypothetical protein